MHEPNRTRGLAIYDLDGTLVSSNVVHQYAYYVRRLPSRRARWARQATLVFSIPLLIALDLYSRETFNRFFYRFYRGMRRDWLLGEAEGLFAAVFEPRLFRNARPQVKTDRSAGYRTILLTGSLDFSLGPLARALGFDEVVANRLVFENGVATGELAPPVLAGREKVNEIQRLCRQYNVETARSKAYSDSLSDLPMLEAVGNPVATNPGSRLRAIAGRRGWPVLSLK